MTDALNDRRGGPIGEPPHQGTSGVVSTPVVQHVIYSRGAAADTGDRDLPPPPRFAPENRGDPHYAGSALSVPRPIPTRPDGRIAGLREAAQLMREREAAWLAAGPDRMNALAAGTFRAAASIIEGHADLLEAVTRHE